MNRTDNCEYPWVVYSGKPEDIDAIDAIMTAAFDPIYGESWTRDQCQACFALPGYRWLLATENSNPVGFLLSRSVAGESEMMLLAVHPDHREQRVASCLIQHWFEDCRYGNIGRAWLEVRETNPAIQLYTRLGFIKSGLRPNYYSGSDGCSAAAITMVIKLRSE